MHRLIGIHEACTMTDTVAVTPSTEDPVVAEGDRAMGVIRDAAVVLGDDGRIAWIGRRGEEPPSFHQIPTTDLGGVLVLPGLVDAHTHLVFAGDRTRDYAARCAGLSYEEVAARGGGIRLTVAATRAASHEELVALSRPRVASLLAHGVTTIEVKSGYGLTVADELELLEVIRALDQTGPARLVPTLLAAHIVPDEMRHDRAGYVSMVTDEILPEAARRGLARHVDVFCDVGAFTRDETVRILERGQALGLGLKVHAEQLTHTGSSGAAARLGAVSADHLEHVAPEDMEAMAASGTVAVLLPGAALFLGGQDRAPARSLIQAGVEVALSTDCNPGTCPSTHLPLMTTLGCSMLGLQPHEALLGVTRHAAHAVGLRDGTGTLQEGGPADLSVWDAPSWPHLPYHLGAAPVRSVWVGGRAVIG